MTSQQYNELWSKFHDVIIHDTQTKTNRYVIDKDFKNKSPYTISNKNMKHKLIIIAKMKKRKVQRERKMMMKAHRK